MHLTILKILKNILKNKFKQFTFILLILQLTACLPKINFNKQLLLNPKIIYAKINGIECEFCLKSVIEIIEKIDGISQAQDINYNNYKFNIEEQITTTIEIAYIENKISSLENLTQELKKALNSQGFKLENISENLN